MRRFLLKEYGSWSVMILSFITGILISRAFTLNSFLSLLSLSLFINSKQAFTIWFRQKNIKALYIFFCQIIVATLLILFAFPSGTLRLLPFAIIPLIYIISLYFIGEHALVSELAGFAVLTLSSLIARFSVSGTIDLPLYIATALFFMSGVLKVRIQLKKKLIDRVAMILYLVSAAIIYSSINIPVIILLPLIDNLIFSMTLYRVRLAVTGWIEVAKSILFVILSISFYQ
ncbi:MAG: YwiC-like family protein [Thermodesulfovibrionales bacterium]